MTNTHRTVYSYIWRMWFFADWLHTGELCCLYPTVPPKKQIDQFATVSNKPNKEDCLLTALEMVFNGQIPRIALAPPQTPFQEKIRSLLWSLRPGTTITYKQAADYLGLKKAAQAVGQACARNKFAVLVPCHRIIGSNGIGGYRWGEKLKRELLEMEKQSS